MKIEKTNLIVRYKETDKMGVVHHSNYFVWFELGRTEYIKKLGITYTEIENKGILLPVMEAKCKYINSAKYEDEIVIETKIKEISYSKIIFEYNVLEVKSNMLIAKGETLHPYVNKEFKPRNIKKIIPEFYEILYNSSIE